MLSDQLGLEGSLILRSPEPRDDEAFAALISLNMHATIDGEGLRERRKRWGHFPHIFLVAEVGGEVVGCAEVSEAGQAGSAMFRMAVDPRWRSRGIGTKLFDAVTAEPPFDSAKLFTQVRDNDAASLRFVERLGFVVKSHAYESVYDLAKFRPEDYASYVERVLGRYRIATMAELGDTEENRYKLWEVEHITDHELPGIDLDELPTWETARDAMFTAHYYDPAGEFVVLDGDRWVASCGVASLTEGEHYNMHTAVLKEYRGQGIAIALKTLGTEYAKSKGSRRMRTNNHAGNDAILAINQKFGYEPEPGWYELKRERNS